MVGACDGAAGPSVSDDKRSQSRSLSGVVHLPWHSVELVACKQTDASCLRGPKIITGLSNQMIRWLLKSFCLVLTASSVIFSCHVMQEAAIFSICALLNSQLRPVISISQEVMRCVCFQGFGVVVFSRGRVKDYFRKGQGCND